MTANLFQKIDNADLSKNHVVLLQALSSGATLGKLPFPNKQKISRWTGFSLETIESLMIDLFEMEILTLWEGEGLIIQGDAIPQKLG